MEKIEQQRRAGRVVKQNLYKSWPEDIDSNFITNQGLMKSNFMCICLKTCHVLNILMHSECNTVMICCRIVGKVFVTFCSLLLVMIINALCQSRCCMLCCCHLLMLIWICWCSWYCYVDVVIYFVIAVDPSLHCYVLVVVVMNGFTWSMLDIERGIVLRERETDR